MPITGDPKCINRLFAGVLCFVVVGSLLGCAPAPPRWCARCTELQVLIDDLQSSDVRTCSKASAEIERRWGRAATPAVLSIFSNDDIDVTAEIIWLLGALEDPRALEALDKIAGLQNSRELTASQYTYPETRADLAIRAKEAMARIEGWPKVWSWAPDNIVCMKSAAVYPDRDEEGNQVWHRDWPHKKEYLEKVMAWYNAWKEDRLRGWYDAWKDEPLESVLDEGCGEGW